MLPRNLTATEKALIESLPKLPAFAVVRSTNIWIIEWLSTGERRTGYELHEWMEQKRPNWSIYNQCASKKEVICSIEKATDFAQQFGIVPVLHIEAHGSHAGLAPSRNAHENLLTWEELTIPLQQLNVATKCNLIVVVAACLGFAATQALTQGPRAPAAALVGPDATVLESDLLLGTKEFYRRLMDEKPKLTDIAESASREMRTTGFEIEPFATLAYEAFTEQLIRGIRPAERHARLIRLGQRMRQETRFSEKEIQYRLSKLPEFQTPDQLQQMWDYMFMIDIEPKNKEWFGLNWKEILNRVLPAPFV